MNVLKRRIHFLGCGGAGVAPLMKIFAEKDFIVSGSDLIENEKTSALKDMGLEVFSGHRKENLPEGNDFTLIRSSAVKEGNEEYDEAVRRGVVCIRRGEALAEIANGYKKLVAVSGSHGKTSVTAMIVHVLERLGEKPGYLIGGNVAGKIIAGSAGGKGNEIFVTEADESDGTHKFFRSFTGVVTNVDDDHSWALGGEEMLFRNFTSFADNSKNLIFNSSAVTDKLYSGRSNAVRIEKDGWKKVFPPDVVPDVVRAPFQKENALVAAMAVHTVLPNTDIGGLISLLDDFHGVDRRMSLRYSDGKVSIIEDYAHHPSELEASLDALREISGRDGKKLIVVFQPHRYARLERYFDRFASILKTPDKVFIAPVFSAWEDGKVRSAGDLAAACGGTELEGNDFSLMAEKVFEGVTKNEKILLAVIGAGDVNSIIAPLKRLYSSARA